jgi:hypothetical protein
MPPSIMEIAGGRRVTTRATSAGKVRPPQPKPSHYTATYSSAVLTSLHRGLRAQLTRPKGWGPAFFVLAYFVRSSGEVASVRRALGLPMRVARLTVPLSDIEQRLAGDVTSGRRTTYGRRQHRSRPLRVSAWRM